MKTFDPIQTEACPVTVPGDRRSAAYARHGKRVFDLGVTLLALPFVLPVVAVLWLLVRRDGGVGFFGHTRIGRGGRTFRCWKIRTMVPDADRRLALHLATNAAAAAEWACDFKLRDDPRITPLGRVLRRTSLDELPQLWNVLRGEMSLVGPRPVVTEELRQYGANRWAYLAQTPGITGLWQVSGRNDVSYGARVAMDVQYLQQVSFGLDLRLILRTAAAVIGATGC